MSCVCVTISTRCRAYSLRCMMRLLAEPSRWYPVKPSSVAFCIFARNNFTIGIYGTTCGFHACFNARAAPGCSASCSWLAAACMIHASMELRPWNNSHQNWAHGISIAQLIPSYRKAPIRPSKAFFPSSCKAQKATDLPRPRTSIPARERCKQMSSHSVSSFHSFISPANHHTIGHLSSMQISSKGP